ncbi:substrate-binding domain-containing protein [Candidatus Poriferisodalis sp.]|uniref:substrate-binding domain-containing protein n=1 Tax=Candidatus Poriferisodalis sp. TaxID=3101277 RepID=UPI003B029786
MKRISRLLAVLAVITLFAAACSSDDSDTADEPDTPVQTSADDSGAEVTLTQSDCDKTYHVITHGDSGTFWSVVEVAVKDASEAIGCEVVYFGANNDAQAQSQAIEGAIADGSDGIAISLADPTGLEAAARAVVAAGIPLYTLNSGVNNYKELGAVTHIGQTEIVAGNGAGERFNDLGASHVLCARQEQANIGLEERCEGLADTFSGQVTSEFIGLDANPDEQEQTIASILTADSSIDAVLGVGPNVPLRALDAAESAGRTLLIGGFDLSSDLIAAIEAGDIAFTVDQQQYLQGYLPVILMHLQATNQNTAGGGLPILTGPGFVTPDNAAEVAALVSAGTR